MSGEMMRAIRVTSFGGPEVLKLLDNVPLPVPMSQQVLIRVHVAGVNPVETYIRAGQYARLPTLPFTPGGDLAGVVEKIGEDVTKYKPGDRVFTMRSLSGAYAEMSLADECATFPLHPTLTFRQGAALGVPYFTAYRALFKRAAAVAGESVLVHGASGSVGLATCQIARATGCHVVGTAGSDEGMQLALDCGAHDVFNHREEGYYRQMLAYTEGRRFDVVIEMLANVNLARDTALMATNGRLVVVGSRGSLDFDPRLVIGKELDIRGCMLHSATHNDLAETSDFLTCGVKAGWLCPHVMTSYPLHDAAAAHADVIEHKSGAQGRIVLTVVDADPDPSEN